MLKRICDFLSGLPMTVIGGICLVLSFVLSRLGIKLPVDPAWAAVIINGIPLLYLALWRIRYHSGIRKISSALLISIAMFAAIGVGDLFAAGEVAFIMAVGAILEDMTVERAKKGLKKLLSLAPDQGRRLRDGKEEMIPAEQVQCGDRLRVLPGERIPVDGVIVNGETSVDQSIMTGESLPVDKGVGEEVFCGTVNCFGSIDITALKVGEDSSLHKLIGLVQEAEKKQAPMQRIADAWASWLVPIALCIAILAGLITKEPVRAVTVLVVFCPCALVLATPTAIMAAIGQAARHGVIIKSGEALERMGRVDTIALDKTGTLTYGRLEVCDILSFDPVLTKEELLALLASAEAKSEHPLAKAILAQARQQKLTLQETSDFRMFAGKGIYARIGEQELFCGKEGFLKEHGIPLTEPVTAALEKVRGEGKAVVLAARQDRVLGLVSLSDVLKPEAKDMVLRLHRMHTRTVLFTGDHAQTARYFADQAGILEVKSELLPGEKAKAVEVLQAGGSLVCMIGDGVNDAPALKTAAVGVAMGSMGSDIAVEAADIALIGDDISKIPYLKRLSDATVHTIQLSIALSMCINFIAVSLSVAGVLTPTTGALVHNAGSCFVVLIAALLYDRKFE